MDRTFNNGLGMILVVAQREVDNILAALKKMGERCFVIGAIHRGVKGASISV